MTPHDYVLKPGQLPVLRDLDPGRTDGCSGPDEANQRTGVLSDRLGRIQTMLQAREEIGVLILFQGMDASTKDETIRGVTTKMDPQGCRAWSFKQPTDEERRHDYLWRYHARVPERGQVGIFNRTYYEEAVTSRIHPERLDRHAATLADKKALWRRRYREINHFERYLTDNGIVLLKFFMHVSREKQCERLLERLENPEKQWEFSPSDVEEREHWDAYVEAYEDALAATSTEAAPWYLVPADHEWFSALVVADITNARLERSGLGFPKVPPEDDPERLEALKKLKEQASGD